MNLLNEYFFCVDQKIFSQIASKIECEFTASAAVQAVLDMGFDKGIVQQAVRKQLALKGLVLTIIKYNKKE